MKIQNQVSPHWSRAAKPTLAFRIVAAVFILAALAVFGAAVSLVAAEFQPAKVAAWVAARRAFVSDHPAAAALLYFLGYCGFAALALPGALLVSVAGGALFGPWIGAPLALLSSTAGATLAMLAARYWLRNWVTRRFGAFVKRVDAGVARDGPGWLLAARLTPAIPFFLVNLAVGLTDMPAITFAAFSALGALPLVLVLVSAGAALPTIARASDVLSPKLLVGFSVLALAALVAGPMAKRMRRAERRPPARRRNEASSLVGLEADPASGATPAVAPKARCKADVNE